MSLKLIVLLLGSLLLVNNGFGAPVSSEESSEDLEYVLKTFAQGFKLVGTFLTELIEVEILVAKDGKAVLDKVLNDPKVLEIKTPEMEAILKEIRDYAENLGKELADKKDSDKIFEYENYKILVNKFEADKNDNLSEEAQVIGNSLKENGVTSFKETVETHFKKFIEEIKTSVGGYIEKMSEKNKNGESKNFIEWYNKLVNETDIDKQFGIFDEFFADSDERK